MLTSSPGAIGDVYEELTKLVGAAKLWPVSRGKVDEAEIG